MSYYATGQQTELPHGEACKPIEAASDEDAIKRAEAWATALRLTNTKLYQGRRLVWPKAQSKKICVGG